MPDPQPTPLSAAVADLLETARTLESQMDPPDGIDAVEGRRFLLRMLSASVDTFVEHGDADRPAFHHAEGPTRKMFADCPDADYLRAPIRVGDGRVYRLSGRIPTDACYVGVLLYGRGGRVGATRVDTDLDRDEQGRFELYLATEDPGRRAWLRCDGDESAVMVRQYFADRAAEEPIEVDVELLAEVGHPPPLSAEGLGRQIELAKRMLAAVVDRTRQARQLALQIGTEGFVEVPGDRFFPTPNNKYFVTWFQLPPGRALVVRGRTPSCRYFGISLCNAWMESLDYRHHQVNLNHRDLVTGDDGSFELVLAHADPGHPNWLDLAGHEEGYCLVRCLLLDGEGPALTSEVVRAATLAAPQG